MFFTFARIAIAPFLFQAIFDHSWYQALCLFFIGAITDFLDGFFARYLQQESFLGAALDPLADKLFLMTTFYALSLQISYIPWYFVACMMIKEGMLVIGAVVALLCIPKFAIKPLRSAKILTAYECGLIFFMLSIQTHVVVVSQYVVSFLVYVCLFGNIRVLIEYGLKLYTQLRDNHAH